MNPKHILISRTDNLGDVLLTFPMAGLIKSAFPDTTITFLGKSYTAPLLTCCKHIDHILRWDNLQHKEEKEQVKTLQELNIDACLHVYPDKSISRLMKKAKVPLRVGTWRRVYHLWYCNKWVHLARKQASLHEAQLNLKLLSPLGIHDLPPLDQLHHYYGFSNQFSIKNSLQKYIQPDKYNLILHPKSKGNAREWRMENFLSLIQQLPAKEFEIFITGTETEGQTFRNQLPQSYQVHDLSGQLNMKELIAFIDQCDGLVAASTGPLHIAAALGIQTVGLYAPMRPIHPGRWKPLGAHTKVFALDKKCQQCRNQTFCKCINNVTPTQVGSFLQEGTKKKCKK